MNHLEIAEIGTKVDAFIKNCVIKNPDIDLEYMSENFTGLPPEDGDKNLYNADEYPKDRPAAPDLKTDSHMDEGTTGTNGDSKPQDEQNPGIKKPTSKAKKPAKTRAPFGFSVSDAGVFKVTKSKTDEDKDDLTYICAKLEIVAMIRSYQSGQWGRLLRWQDPDKKNHEWAMPMSALQGDGSEVRRSLSDGGLKMSHTTAAKTALITYLAEYDTPNRARGVDKTGWYGKGDSMVFAFPDETIGNTVEMVRYQSDAPSTTYTKGGTLSGWQTSVAALCAGNGDSVSLAGTLTPKVWTDNQGNAKPALDLIAHQVLTAYHVTRKRRAVAKDDGQGDRSSRSGPPMSVPDDYQGDDLNF